MKTQTRKKQFICGCDFHMIEVEETKTKNFAFYSILIYNHRSMKTGRLLKRPTLFADVALANDEYKKFNDFLRREHGKI